MQKFEVEKDVEVGLKKKERRVLRHHKTGISRPLNNYSCVMGLQIMCDEKGTLGIAT